MIFKQLIAHDWKEGRRNALFEKQLFMTLMVVFSLIYTLGMLLLLGFYSGDIIMALKPNQNPIPIFSSFVLYYLLVDLVLRFFLQSIPVLSIQPYLTLPVKKGKLFHYLLFKSLFNPYLIAPFLIAAPFAFTMIYPYESEFGAWAWLIALFGSFIGTNYLAVYLKRQFADKPRLLIALLASLLLIVLSELYGIFSLQKISVLLYNEVIYQPILILIPIAFAMTMYLLNFRVLQKVGYSNFINAYIPQNSSNFTKLTFLERFGEMGQMLMLDVRLMLRNKRPKSVLWVSFLFVLYGLIFYSDPKIASNDYILMLGGLIITGMFLLNYGQYMHSWDAGFFDFLLTSPITAKKYYESKFWLFAVATILAFVLSIPYAYYGWRIVLVNFVMMLFNIGVNSFVTMFTTSFGPKAIDLKKGTFFNYQGAGAPQFLLIIPIFLLPALIYSPFSILGKPNHGIIALGFVGFLGIVSHAFWLKLLGKNLIGKKHEIAKNFRENL